MNRRAALALAFALAAAGPPAAAAGEVPDQQMRFGLRVPPAQWAALPAALSAQPADPANPLTLTLALPAEWAQAPDWPALEAAAEAAQAGRARLAVTTELPAGAEEAAALAYLVALSERVGHRADTLGLSLSQGALSEALRQDPDQLALRYKRLSSALRGRGAARLTFGEVDAGALPLMEPLYAREFRAYVEGYSAVAGPDGAVDQEVHDFLQKYHPGAPLWGHLPPARTALGAQVAAMVALSRGLDFVDLESPDPAAAWGGLLALRGALSPRTGVGVVTEASGIWEKGRYRGDVGALNFLDADTFVQGMLLVANTAVSPAGTLEVVLPTEDLSSPRAFALPAGASAPLEFTVDRKKGETTVKVPWTGTPVLVLFERLKTGAVGQGEDVSVTGEYRIPVELILARHQAVQQAQDILLENYQARARVDYHFKLPGATSSLDVSFENRFFYEKGAGARWVQEQFLINGVAWKGKTIPELPIIDPERVNSLPLALSLGRDYQYKYLRDEVVEGRPCFLVEFIPLPGATESLYEGRVWIDSESYARVKMSVRQTGLKPPQVSNDETDFYTDVPGPDGKPLRLLTRVEGQQIISFTGRNIAAEREVTFSALELNAPTFRAALAEAEAGDRPMLQETDAGPRYMEKLPDGTRVVKPEQDSSNLFAVGGAYYDDSLDYPIPLIGVNWLDWDWRKTGTQVNLFAAGVVNSLSVSKVDLLPKVDGRAEALLFLIPFQDKFFIGGAEDERQRVKVLRETASLGAGWRVTEFSKLSLGIDATYRNYSGDGETMDPLPAGLPQPGATPADFVLPSDHTDLALTLGFDYARRGWGAALEYEAHRRTQWDPWGLNLEHADVADQEAYALWGATLSKSFHLPKFQKVSASLSWLDGQDLDRFSQYEFTYMGKRSLAGFSGSGVRFDRGAIARLHYEFNVGDVIRFGFGVDQARVKPLRAAPGWEEHTGLGVTGSITGPWQTLWTLDAGYAVRSDIPSVRGNVTVALGILKLW